MKNEPLSGKELRRVVRLTICIAVVAVAMCVKLLFPDVIQGIREDALYLLSSDMDYEAALSAMGEAVAGEKDFREAMTEVYEYAFMMTDDAVEAAVTEETETEAEEEEPEDTDVPTIRNLTYIHSGEEAPPEGATYAMANIGFEYCVPVSGTLTSPFGYRNHPVDGEVKFHYGIDFGAEDGTDISAFADGTVYAVGESEILGLYVMIDHADGVRTTYGHCSELLVSGGDEVKMGDKIAEVGSTGNATGSCLHFEIEVNGVNVDPEYYLTWV